MATVPDTVTNAGIGADQDFVLHPNGPPPGAIDVRDHGAAMDGTTDDSGALQSAIDAAGAGDIVYIPAGDMRINSRVTADAAANGISIMGSGKSTRLVCTTGTTSNRNFPLYLRAASTSSPLENITLRDFWMDGVKSRTYNGTDWDVEQIGLMVGYDSDDNNNSNLLVENVWLSNFSHQNNRFASVDLTVRYCSSWGAGVYHGFVTDNVGTPPVTCEYCYARDNGTHGFDAHGHTVVRHLLSESNGWGGKDTLNTLSTVWEDVVFRNNENIGWMMPTNVSQNITMKEVMAIDNHTHGFYIAGEGDLTVPAGSSMYAFNNATGTNAGNIWFTGSWAVDIDEIVTGGANNGPGVDFDSGNSGTVGTVRHYNNAGGGVVNDSSVSIGTISSDSSIAPMAIPQNDDGSAGSGSTTTGGSGGGTGSGSPTPPGTTIESWESGTVGSEWTTSTAGAFGVDTADATDGTNSLYYDGTTYDSWEHLLSLSGLPTYPAQGDTILWRQKLEGTGSDGVFIWGAQSTTWPPNSYGARVDQDSAGDTISLEKDFSTTLNSATTTVPKGEWLTFEVVWGDDGAGNVQLTLTLYDAAGAQVTTFSATDTGATQYTSGGIGIEWVDAAESTTPRWDAISLGAETDVLYLNKSGSAVPHEVWLNQNGTAVPVELYINQNGTATRASR